MRFNSKLVGVLHIAICVALISPLCSGSENEDFEPLRLVRQGSDDGPTIARALTMTFLTEAEWREEVEIIKGRYDDWQKQSESDIGTYLNDRFILVGLSAAGGKIDKIKKGIIWLAFYKEFNQQPPSIVIKFMREHQGSLERLFTDFKWEKASAYIKNKEWRKDIEERKKAELAASILKSNQNND